MSEMVNMAPPWQGMTPEEISRAVAAGERPLIAPELAANAPTGWIELMQQTDPILMRFMTLFQEQVCRNVEHAREFDNASAIRQTSRLSASGDASNHEVKMGMYYSMP